MHLFTVCIIVFYATRLSVIGFQSTMNFDQPKANAKRRRIDESMFEPFEPEDQGNGVKLVDRPRFLTRLPLCMGTPTVIKSNFAEQPEQKKQTDHQSTFIMFKENNIYTLHGTLKDILQFVADISENKS